MDNLGKLCRDLDSVSDFLLLFNTSLTYSTCVRYCYCYCELAIFLFFHTAVFCCCFCFFSTSFTGIIDCGFYALCVAGCDKIGWVVIFKIVASNQQTTQRIGRQPMNEKTWTVISTAGIMIIWVLAPMDSVLNETIIAHFNYVSCFNLDLNSRKTHSKWFFSSLAISNRKSLSRIVWLHTHTPVTQQVGFLSTTK